MISAPKARRETVRDTLHGVVIEDHYRWMEKTDSPELRKWVKAQNAYTDSILTPDPMYRAFRKRLTELMRSKSVAGPMPAGKYFYYLSRGGRQEQSVLMRKRGLRGRPHVVVDPNRWSKDGTTAMSWWSPSPDGRYVAYGYDVGGREQATLKVFDLDRGRELGETIPRVYYEPVVWAPDSRALMYTAYPDPKGLPPGEMMFNGRVLEHRLGTDPAKDTLTFGDQAEKPFHMPYPIYHDKQGYRVCILGIDVTTSDIYLSMPGRADFRRVVRRTKVPGFGCAVVGNRLFAPVSIAAPNYRVVAIDPNNPEQAHWKDIVPETDLPMSGVAFAKDGIYVARLRDVVSILEHYTYEGRRTREIPLPTLGSITVMSADPDLPGLVFQFESFAFPPTLYYVDARSGLRMLARTDVKVKAARYVASQEFCPSKDGTRVPMFIVRRRDVAPNGVRPTLLCGYGGYGIAVAPHFARFALAWLEKGGVYAVANIRGGGEYGEKWHEAGMLANKQNVFDDFIAVAEHLQKQWTRPDRTGIFGASNGGLLIGAVVTQRPELFAAAVAGVPVMDVMRFRLGRIGAINVGEFGTPEDPEQFKYLLAYSPYQKVRSGQTYPATMITTAENDSRVEPWQAYKMAALMQAEAGNGPDRPILLYAQSKAGHGMTSSTQQAIDECSRILTFLARYAGLGNGRIAAGYVPRLKDKARKQGKTRR